jgi:hypothetical protein
MFTGVKKSKGGTKVMKTFIRNVLIVAPLLFQSSSIVAQTVDYQGKTVYIKSSQTWTVPTGVSTIYTRLVGGGGGGFGDHCLFTSGRDGSGTSVKVGTVTATAFGGSGARGSCSVHAVQGIGGGTSSNCDFSVIGGNGQSVGSRSSSAGGSPFMYGSGGASTFNPTQLSGVGFGYGGSGVLGSGQGTNTAGGGAGGFCEKTFSVMAGTTVHIDIGNGGAAGNWGTAGAKGLVVIQY